MNDLQTIGNLLQKKEAALKNFLGNQENALRFMSSVMQCVQANPKLGECTHESVQGAFMECAALGLYPSNHSGDCYVIPYKDHGIMNAQFQLGYKGIKTLAYRSGVLRCGSEVVYKKDKFKQILGTIQQLTHEPAEGDRGEAIGAYAWAEVTRGAIVFKYMSKAEIWEIAKTSASYKSDIKWKTKKSLWLNTANDPQLWMWQKTVFKQLAKLMPTSDKLDRAIYLDNVSERGGYIKSESEVVEVPFAETSEEKIDKVQAKKEALREKKGQPIAKTAQAKNDMEVVSEVLGPDVEESFVPDEEYPLDNVTPPNHE